MKSFRFKTATALAMASLFIASGAWAQSDTEEAPKTDPEAGEPVIVVTGTRIPRPELQGSIPGSQISGEQIQARGFTNILDALNDIPLVGPGASPVGNAGGQPASLGASFVDLLDLGTARTLTLVNGRRFVSGNAGTLFVAANATGSQVDLNSIPTELVARTDVLTVGGAVAYGSDAIAGVVNVILKDDFKGLSFNARSGVSSRGDLFNYQLGGTAGTDFGGGRGNIAVSVQYNRDDGLQGNRRSAFSSSFVAPTFFGNGFRRNPAFSAALPIDVTGANNGAFLRATDDGIPGNRFLPLLSGGSSVLSDGGTVLQFTGALPAGVTAGGFSAIVGGVQAGALQALAGNTQIVPGGGVPGAQAVGGPGLPPNTFTRFAPSSLPAGVMAQQVITALAPGFVIPPNTPPSQLNTLAINLLQAARPTPREFLAQNPNTPINAFIGSLIPAFLDVPNPDAASAPFLPRTAVPLRFDSSGQLVPYTVARFDAGTPATTGGAPGGDFFNGSRNIVLRTQQERLIGNLIAHYDLTDNIRFYTENLFANVKNRAIRNAASANNIALGGTENAAIIANLNNPFLTDAQRAQLVASGVPTTGAAANLFILSRTNQDITGDNGAFVESDTYRSVNGFKGDFSLLDREFTFDAAVGYGLNKARIGTTNIRDIEYALALDAVRDANGNIVCRVQTPGASTALPLGVVSPQLVRVRGADGVLVEQLVTRTVTPEQISGCRPLNPFGVNQMSQASKDYVTFNSVSRNKSEQIFGTLTLASTNILTLPGGGVGFAINGEYRRDLLRFEPTDEQKLGVSRVAASAETRGVVRSTEISAELRVPIFGEDFTAPLFRSFEFSPGVRFVRQEGNAPDVRRLNGMLETNEAKGDWNTLYTLAATWRPIPDILIRGNATRSLRQPSVVELFLGNQPAFNVPTDPCGNAQIGSGNVPATRRANCIAEVRRLGIANNDTDAANFLATFVPAGQALQGGFAGSPGLRPEKGESWTAGAVFTPRFLPGFSLFADYIDVEVKNLIIPTTLSNAAQFCYDSPTFNDTSAQLGVNTCTFFSRAAMTSGGTTQFNIQNGFASGFINLGALKVRSLNAGFTYAFDLANLFGGKEGSRFTLTGNAYRLFDYIQSASGRFDDSQNSAGSFFRPKLETQLTGRFENDSLFAQWTWNWQKKTRLFNANTGAFATIENQDVIDFPAFSLHDASFGLKVADRFVLQFTVRNVFDKNYAGLRGFANAAGVIGTSGEVDPLGRRFQATIRGSF